MFGTARNVFEEALASITTARDFGIVFNAYMKFEEQMVEAENDEEDEENEEDNDVEDQLNALIDYTFRDIGVKSSD